VISNFIVQSLRNEPITIYGDGQQTRSFCYVDDLIEAFTRFMAVETDSTPVNLGNPTETTIGEIAMMIRTMCGSTVDLVRRQLPADDPTRRCPDITRARTLLNGWSPQISLATGLGRTIADFRDRDAS
jgi:UDP-glucuronate decarboxylase